MVEEFNEEEYKSFFEWLLDKDVNINKEVDITLLMTHEKPYIYYPDEIKQLLETKLMQRLGRITQLGTGILSNPTNYHTRLEHSKGAGNNATKFYMHQFKNDHWRTGIEKENRKTEVLADIIQMYTHDIGHNVLSHALEVLIVAIKPIVGYGAAHEILGRRILNQSEEVVQVLNSIHPDLLNDLNKVSQEDYDLKSLKEGSVDFDRLDFMVRDVLYFGLDEKRELAERLISNCTIYNTWINNKRTSIPVFEYEALGDIKEFLEYRAYNYKNEYASNERKALDNLAVYFCEKLASSEYDCELKSYVNHCVENGGEGIDLKLFEEWDDVRYYNELINIAKNCPDEDLKCLAIDCLPNLEGLTNLAFGLLDLKPENIDNLEGYQKDFYENVKSLVKEDGPLHRKLLAKKEAQVVFLDSSSKKSVDKVFKKIEKQGIPKQKLDSLISWQKVIKKYDESIFVKGRNGKIYRYDEHPDLNHDLTPYINCGALALPVQMRENGFNDMEIAKVQSEFQKYNEKNKKAPLKSDSKSVYEKEDMKYRAEEEMDRG